MLFTNATVFTPSGFRRGELRTENGRFADPSAGGADGGVTDLQGALVLPGLVEIHSHGNSGADFSDGDYEGLCTMARYYAAHGITSFAPASMTLPYDTLAAAFAAGKRLHDGRPKDCARLMGIHMEGPFFSEKKKGAQNAAYLKAPDIDAFTALYEGCGGLVRIVDLAAELPGAAEFAAAASKLCTVSVAHTDAGYADAAAVFDAGATHLTHLFNAMPPIHHRKPGVIGAASERNVVAELICDGFHVHESAVRMAFRLFPDRICLISDSLRCCGMPDGEYDFAGQTVYLRDNAARLADGTIAGSVTDLFSCMKNAIAFGIPREQAIRSATILPARELGADGEIGSIETGKRADFVVCDEELNVLNVYIGGDEIMKNE